MDNLRRAFNPNFEEKTSPEEVRLRSEEETLKSEEGTLNPEFKAKEKLSFWQFMSEYGNL